MGFGVCCQLLRLLSKFLDQTDTVYVLPNVYIEPVLTGQYKTNTTLWTHSYSLYPGEIAKTCISLFIYYTQPSTDMPIFQGLYVPVYLLPSLWLALHFPPASPWVRHIWLPLSPDLHVASSSSCAPLPCTEAQLEATGRRRRRRSSPGFYSTWGARIWAEIPQICPSIQPAWVSLQKSPMESHW